MPPPIIFATLRESALRLQRSPGFLAVFLKYFGQFLAGQKTHLVASHVMLSEFPDKIVSLSSEIDQQTIVLFV